MKRGEQVAGGAVVRMGMGGVFVGKATRNISCKTLPEQFFAFL